MVAFLVDCRITLLFSIAHEEERRKQMKLRKKLCELDCEWYIFIDFSKFLWCAVKKGKIYLRNYVAVEVCDKKERFTLDFSFTLSLSLSSLRNTVMSCAFRFCLIWFFIDFCMTSINWRITYRVWYQFSHLRACSFSPKYKRGHVVATNQCRTCPNCKRTVLCQIKVLFCLRIRFNRLC